MSLRRQILHLYGRMCEDTGHPFKSCPHFFAHQRRDVMLDLSPNELSGKHTILKNLAMRAINNTLRYTVAIASTDNGVS